MSGLLSSLPERTIKEKSISELRVEFEKLDESKKSIAEAQSEILSEVLARTKESFAKQLMAKGKDYGDVSAVVEGVKLKFSKKKKVAWDNNKLEEAAKLAPADKVEAIFEIKRSLTEVVFKGLETFFPKEHAFYKAVVAARTVTPEPEKVTFDK